MKDWEIVLMLADLLVEIIPEIDALEAIELAYVVLESVVKVTDARLQS